MDTLICNEKSSGVGVGLALSAVHAAASIFPNAWLPLKFRNHCIRLESVSHFEEKKIEASTGN